MTTHAITGQTPKAKTLTTGTTTTTRPRSSIMHMLNEALSRARMRSPQNSSEARRSARRVAMQAHRQLAREQGDVSQFMLR
jgi:hypothetical protein